MEFSRATVWPLHKKHRHELRYHLAEFEIQIRTILQHAWAEIEHDRNYKFSGELPEDIQRRFKLVAGSLELADKEFDRLATDIDLLNVLVEKGTKEGNLDFEINTTTLKQFLATKFDVLIPHLIQPIFPTPESEIEILEELKKFGLKNLNDLNNIIPKDFISAMKSSENNSSNFLGILRWIMISNDWKKYFEHAYNYRWSPINLDIRSILAHYKVPTDYIKKKYAN